MSLHTVPKLDVRVSAGNSRWKRHRDGLGNEYNLRTSHLRGYTLKEIWEIFVADSPFGAEAINRQVKVQSQAVVSYAMTLMDKIRGWEEEEGEQEHRGLGQELQRACVCQHESCDMQWTNHMHKLRSIMEAVNWVCEDALDELMWVSEQTNRYRKQKFWNPCNTTSEFHV